MRTIKTSDLRAGDRIRSPYLNQLDWTITAAPTVIEAGNPILGTDGSMSWAVGSWFVPVTSDYPSNIETRRGYLIRSRSTVTVEAF